MPSIEPAASSGIHTAPSGERHIPTSTRADGSIRKEIRIRPGYRPPEDVEIYKNRTADSWKNRIGTGVLGAESAQKGVEITSNSKNAKRRQARKKARATEDIREVDKDSSPLVADNAIPVTSHQAAEGSTTDGAIIPDSLSPQFEREKQARNIRKKLRQAKDLQTKKNSGGSLLPEQLSKVIKIHELTRQLDALGLGNEDMDEPKSSS